MAKKFTLLIDEKWLSFLIEHAYNHIEGDEVFQLLDEEDIELCDDCQVYLTSDGEVVWDTFRCPSQKEYCLNCCKCPGEHEEGGYYN